MKRLARVGLAHIFLAILGTRRLYRKIVRPVRLGVRALVFEDDKVLLVRHHSHTYWLAPGGLAERGESLSQTAVREVREETGCEVAVERLLGIYSMRHEGMTLRTAVFICRPLTSISNNVTFEIAEARYWPIDALPDTQGMLEQRLVEYAAGAQGLIGEF